MNPEQGWTAVQTKPKCERVVSSALETKGYESFYPIYRVRRRWSDRWVHVERPLFPGYVFCRTASSTYGKILLTIGVVRIVGFRGIPEEVPAGEIEALRRVNQTGIPRMPHEYLRSGTRVCVESGPLKGVEGIYSNGSDHRRLVLSVNLLQRSIAVTLDPEVAVRVVARPATEVSASEITSKEFRQTEKSK